MTSHHPALALAGACLWSALYASPLSAHQPHCTDGRLMIELVAADPVIVTPTGLAIDEHGGLWVIENHTHERPPQYQGPPSDRIRVFEDFDDRGRPRKVHTFADGFKNAMSLARCRDGTIYLATRADITTLRDAKGHGAADQRRVIIRLDTRGAYPHNGLSGLAFDALGNLYFSLGENLGASYRLVGSDGTTFRGGGEGGSIYRCRPDGTGLTRVATGFWNTFALTVDAFGRLFAVDNDPDSRGPCRLLHIVPGGDYGYRYRNGRKGLHPFTAWNGELPGTLPMIAGTSEAPSGVIAYESAGLPPDFRGDLLVTSWGDHVVERFHLTPRGASFTSRAQIIVRGGEDFRPVAVAAGPDGCLYLTDWVDKSYPVHGKGRIWRIRPKQPPADDGLRPSQAEHLSRSNLLRLLGDTRIEIRSAATAALAARGMDVRPALRDALRQAHDPRARVHALWAAATASPPMTDLFAQALEDPTAEVRAEAARLYGETLGRRDAQGEQPLLAVATADPHPEVRMQATLQLRSRPALESILSRVTDPDPFLASGTLEVLGRAANTPWLLDRAEAADPALRLGVLLALRRAGVADGRKPLSRWLRDPDPYVRRAAVQWVGEERLDELAPLLDDALAQAPVTRDVFEAVLASRDFFASANRTPTDEPSGARFIAQVVHDVSKPPAVRATALRMLPPDHPDLRAATLRQLVRSQDATLRDEAVRTIALRTDNASQQFLRDLAADRRAPTAARAHAVLGLANSAQTSSATRDLLVGMLGDPHLNRDALRSLRSAGQRPEIRDALRAAWERTTLPATDRAELAEQVLFALQATAGAERGDRLGALRAAAGQRPRGEAAWRDALSGAGDPAAGERVFFHPNGPRCFACHRVDGRGAAIGPDLSTIGRSASRDKIIDSILAPSREIAPRFSSWRISTRDGRVLTGMIVEETFDSTLKIADTTGRVEAIHRTEVEERQPLPTSIMPDNLPDLMTRREFLDLVEFLAHRR